MKKLLLADAHQLSASPPEYEATRQQIEIAEYKTFTLSESDFDDLVFKEIYEEEVVPLVECQQIYGEIRDIIKANPEIQRPNAFYRFLEDTYVDSGVMGARRQIKLHKDSISLAGLLREIIENPSVLSRKRFVELYRAGMQSGASCILDERFSGCCTDHIDPAIVQQDLDELKAHGDKVEEFADKRLAHRDKKQPVIPTFGELDAVIDCLQKLTAKYSLLIKAEDLTNTFVPHFIGEVDMEVIFSVPWIRSD